MEKDTSEQLIISLKDEISCLKEQIVQQQEALVKLEEPTPVPEEPTPVPKEPTPVPRTLNLSYHRVDILSEIVEHPTSQTGIQTLEVRSSEQSVEATIESDVASIQTETIELPTLPIELPTPASVLSVQSTEVPPVVGVDERVGVDAGVQTDVTTRWLFAEEEEEMMEMVEVEDLDYTCDDRVYEFECENVNGVDGVEKEVDLVELYPSMVEKYVGHEQKHISHHGHNHHHHHSHIHQHGHRFSNYFDGQFPIQPPSHLIDQLSESLIRGETGANEIMGDHYKSRYNIF